MLLLLLFLLLLVVVVVVVVVIVLFALQPTNMIAALFLVPHFLTSPTSFSLRQNGSIGVFSYQQANALWENPKLACCGDSLSGTCPPLVSCSSLQYIKNGFCELLTVCPSTTSFQDTPPTQITDRTCKLATVCQPGTYISVNITATSDRSCLPCQNETYQWATNQFACIATRKCTESRPEASPPTPTSDRVCTNYRFVGRVFEAVSITALSNVIVSGSAQLASGNFYNAEATTNLDGYFELYHPNDNSTFTLFPYDPLDFVRSYDFFLDFQMPSKEIDYPVSIPIDASPKPGENKEKKMYHGVCFCFGFVFFLFFFAILLLLDLRSHFLLFASSFSCFLLALFSLPVLLVLLRLLFFHLPLLNHSSSSRFFLLGINCFPTLPTQNSRRHPDNSGLGFLSSRLGFVPDIALDHNTTQLRQQNLNRSSDRCDCAPLGRARVLFPVRDNRNHWLGSRHQSLLHHQPLQQNLQQLPGLHQFRGLRTRFVRWLWRLYQQFARFCGRYRLHRGRSLPRVHCGLCRNLPVELPAQ